MKLAAQSEIKMSVVSAKTGTPVPRRSVFHFKARIQLILICLAFCNAGAQASAICPTKANALNGLLITWNTGTKTKIKYSGNNTVIAEDAFPNGMKSSVNSFLGIIVLSSHNPDGVTTEAFTSPPPEELLLNWDGKPVEFNYELTVTQSTGKKFTINTRQRLERNGVLSLKIGNCEYSAYKLHREVLGDSQPARSDMIFVPELSYYLEMHSKSFPGGKLRRYDIEAVAIAPMEE
jgi:hypothetical protein